MEKKNDGGPAFPEVYVNSDGSKDQLPGMTLRDYFAIHASFDDVNNDLMVDMAEAKIPKGLSDADRYARMLARARYDFADAMLAEQDE